MTQGTEKKPQRRTHLVYTLPLLAAAGLLLAILLLVRMLGAPADAVVRPDYPAYAADIFANNSVGQAFQASHDGLCRLDVLIRPVLGPCQLDVRLQTSETEDALGSSLSCPRDESAWYTIRFPRIPDSAGRTVQWAVEPSSPLSDTVASLETTLGNSRPEGNLIINGRPTASDAVFVPYYCTPKALTSLSASWLRENSARIQVQLLTGFVGIALLMTLALLVFPPLTEPMGADPLQITLGVIGLVAIVALSLIIVNTRLWSPAAARLDPVTAPQVKPEVGPYVAADLIANLHASGTTIDSPIDWYIEPRWVALDGDRRPGLTMHPPSQVSFTVEVPPEARLHAAATMDPEVWDPEMGDGVLFVVKTVVDGVEETVYYQEIDPKNEASDRRWHDFDVDLTPYAGRTIQIVFSTSPLGSNAWDWAVWGMPVVLTP